MVYHDGAYHLFYQYNPDDTDWGSVHWGHATSEDLFNWKNQGSKLEPEDDVLQFSGGAVVDSENTSGFGRDSLVLTYTGHHRDTRIEDQRLAYSTDGGKSVTKYADNPVIPSNSPDFRDPNVFRYEPDDSWRLVVSRVSATNDRPAGIEIYRSEDLHDWTYESTYEKRAIHDATEWECPDLYELPVKGGDTKWVLTVSADGGRVDHLVGEFDGTDFSLDRRVVADKGHDYYAAMSWANEPQDRRIALGWMNNWRYAEEIPDPGWRGTMTVPRRVTLVEDGDTVDVRQSPAGELTTLRGTKLTSLDSERLHSGDEPLANEGVSGRCLDIEMAIAPGNADTVGLDVRKGEEQQTTISYHTDTEMLLFDRSKSGTYFDTASSGATSADLQPMDDGTISLRVLVDRSSVEVFANDGRLAMSNLIYPDWQSDGISLFTENGDAEIVSLDVWELSLTQ